VSERTGTWWPFAIPAVVAVVAVALTFTLESTHDKHSALACPTFLRKSGAKPRVPALSDRVNTEDRLAPDRLPTDVVVCAYPGAGGSSQLVGSKVLHGRFENLVTTLTRAPRKTATAASCAAPNATANDGDYLLGLTYTDGPEWIAVTGNPCAATPATNGTFDSSAQLADQLRSAYRTGTWPAR
jgi:hypothetical protein